MCACKCNEWGERPLYIGIYICMHFTYHSNYIMPGQQNEQSEWVGRGDSKYMYTISTTV